MRLDELSSEIKDKLTAAGIGEADNETRVILRELADVTPTDLFSHPEKDIDDNTLAAIREVVNRRLQREPLQYILGKWEFMGFEFEVRSGVLIPRPDTEILVECVLKELHDGMRFLDLCTGTGCIAISLLNLSNGCEATAVDISPIAYELATDNARKYPKSEKLNVVIGDLYDGACGTYDIIVSNPPYFDNSLEGPDERRNLARHTESLSWREVIRFAVDFLAEDGRVVLIVPKQEETALLRFAASFGFAPARLISISTAPSKPPRRLIAEFVRQGAAITKASQAPAPVRQGTTNEPSQSADQVHQNIKPNTSRESIVIGDETYKNAVQAFYL